MDFPDLTNGLFECLGTVAIAGHIVRVIKDKTVAGVSIWAAVFFASWGVWNLYYYPHLGQWWSFAGGIGIVLGNLTWIALLIYFTKHPGGKFAGTGVERTPFQPDHRNLLDATTSTLRRLLTARKHYTVLLEGELEETVPHANASGWVTSRFRTGEDLRVRIAALEKELGVPD